MAQGSKHEPNRVPQQPNTTPQKYDQIIDRLIQKLDDSGVRTWELLREQLDHGEEQYISGEVTVTARCAVFTAVANSSCSRPDKSSLALIVAV